MRIEERLRTRARRLRDEVDASLDEADVEDALHRTTAPAEVARPGRSRVLVGAAAAAVVVAAVAVGALALGDGADDDEQVAAEGDRGSPTTDGDPGTGSPSTTADEDPTVEPGGVAFDVLGRVSPTDHRAGSMAFAGVADALTDQWTLTGSDRPVPTVDVGRRAVLVFTVSPSEECTGPLTTMRLDGDVLAPVFAEGRPNGCDGGPGPQTHVVATDRAELPTTFWLVLESALVADHGEQRMAVDLGENFASSEPPREQAGPPAPQGPDLAEAEPGREITFDRIGDVSLGQALGPSEYRPYDGRSSCGYWGPAQPSHDGDQPLDGLVSIDDGRATVESIMVRRNPRYRTASGVGVGTTLATLERIYGDDLVVDRADGWDDPTDGLLASYGDVAAVRNGDRALTFHLARDTVSAVKLSPADFWGDDEGCA